MAQKNKINNSVETHLANLNIRYKGYERYESTDILIEGTDNPDYRWRITFKQTGRRTGAVSLLDALQQVRQAIDPNLSHREAPAPEFGAYGRGKSPHQFRKSKSADPKQFGLGITEEDL